MADTFEINGVLPIYLGEHPDDYDDTGTLIAYDANATIDGSYKEDDEWLRGVDDDIADLEDDLDSDEIQGFDSIEGKRERLDKAKALLRKLERKRADAPKRKKALRKRLANRIRRVKRRIQRLESKISPKQRRGRKRERRGEREERDGDAGGGRGTGNDLYSIVAARLNLEHVVLLPMKTSEGELRAYAFQVAGSNTSDTGRWSCKAPNYADFRVHGFVVQAVAHSKLVASDNGGSHAAPIAALVALDDLKVDGDSDVVYGPNEAMLNPRTELSASALLITTFLRKRPTFPKNAVASASTTLSQYLDVDDDQGEAISGIMSVSLIVEVTSDEKAGIGVGRG